MGSLNYEQYILNLIKSDDLRMNALHVVSQLDLPGWLIAAGFVRNLIWDELFNLTTDLNDIDVIYY